jgi:hypothetical protein
MAPIATITMSPRLASKSSSLAPVRIFCVYARTTRTDTLPGFGGLTAAIECIRHGHTPIIYESFPSLKILGDIITFGPNAGRIFARWSGGSVAASMRKISIDLTEYGFNIHKWDTGEVVINQKTPPRDERAPNFNGHRGELHEIVFNYAKSLGVEINLGQRVEKYWEDEGEAGIVLEDGTRVAGDLVVASDGVRSKARTLVLGYEDKPKSSGYAVWRAWFSNQDMLADLETKQFCDNGDTFNGWIGKLHPLFCRRGDTDYWQAPTSTSSSVPSKTVQTAAGYSRIATPTTSTSLGLSPATSKTLRKSSKAGTPCAGKLCPRPPNQSS